MKIKKIGKIIGIVLLTLIAVILIFTLVTFIINKIKTKQEIELLKEKGYYNPVSVGEYSLNVATFGNENGEHTIVGLAGLGMGDFSVAARQMTACLEEDNLVVFVDGSQLSANAFEEEEAYEIGMGDRFLAFLAKVGFDRYVLRDYFYHYPDNYSEEEQYLGDALMLMTLDSIATVSEDANLAKNAQAAFNGIITNDIPKLYICASWGLETKEDIIECNKWINRQIEINGFDMELRPTEYDDETAGEIIKEFIAGLE